MVRMGYQIGCELVGIPNRTGLEVVLDCFEINTGKIFIEDESVGSPYGDVDAECLSCCEPRFALVYKCCITYV